MSEEGNNQVPKNEDDTQYEYNYNNNWQPAQNSNNEQANERTPYGIFMEAVKNYLPADAVEDAWSKLSDNGKKELRNSSILIEAVERIFRRDITAEQQQNLFDIIKFLINKEVDPNYKSYADSPRNLISTVVAGNSDIAIPILEILKGKVNMNGGSGTIPPLILAIQAKQYRTVEWLLSNKLVDINKFDDSKKARSDSNIVIRAYNSPLYHAIVDAQNIDLVKLLIENGANVNYIDGYLDPLLHTVISGSFMTKNSTNKANIAFRAYQLAVIDLLLKSKYLSPVKDNRPLQDGSRRTAIFLAISKGDFEIMQKVLDRDDFAKQIDIPNKNGEEPFDILVSRSSYSDKRFGINRAESEKYDEILRYLIKKKYITNNNDILSLFRKAITKGGGEGDELMLQAMYNNGVISNPGVRLSPEPTVNGSGFMADMPAMSYVVKHGMLEVFKKFIGMYDKTLLKDVLLKKPTILIAAINSTPMKSPSQQEEVVRTLLTLGADPDGRDLGGRIEITPLMKAIQLGEGYLVNALLEKGANPNLLSKPEGRGQIAVTPLIEAINTNNELIVELLLENKADPNISDSVGSLPLNLAFKMKNSKIIKMLKEKGAKATGLLIDASMAGDIELVRDLVENKEDPIDPNATVKMLGQDVNAYDVAKTMEIRLFLAPYIDVDSPRFEGFPKEAFEMFLELWIKSPGGTIKNGTLCPLCFTVAYKGSGCLYTDHDCVAYAASQKSGKPNFIHQKLYNAFVTQTVTGPSFVWCSTCNRPCVNPVRNGHAHHVIGPPIPAKHTNEQIVGNAFDSEGCYSNLGGDYVEKIFRFKKLVEIMCKLNNEYIGKISDNIARCLQREELIGCAVEFKSFFESKDFCKNVVKEYEKIKSEQYIIEGLHFFNEIATGLADIESEEELNEFYETLIASRDDIVKHQYYLVENYKNDAIKALLKSLEKLYGKLIGYPEPEKEVMMEGLKTFGTEVKKDTNIFANAIDPLETGSKRWDRIDNLKQYIKNNRYNDNLIIPLLDEVHEILRNRKFNIPESCIPKMEEEVKEKEPEPIESVKRIATLIKPPTEIPNDGELECIFHMESHSEDKRPLYRCHHVQPKDKPEDAVEYYDHPDEVLYCKWGIIGYINNYTYDPLGATKCFDPYGMCRGNFHPNEIKSFFFNPFETDADIEAFKEFEQKVQNNAKGQAYNQAVELVDKDWEEELKREMRDYEESKFLWEHSDRLEPAPIPPAQIRADLAKYEEAKRRIIEVRKKQWDNAVYWVNNDGNPKPVPALLEGMKTKPVVNRSKYVSKPIEWTDEELKIRMERAKKSFKKNWEDYAAIWESKSNVFLKNFGSEYNAKNDNNYSNSMKFLYGSDNEGFENNQAGGGNTKYAYYTISEPDEVGAPSQVCPLPKKVVRGGYKKTRKQKKIVKTRKAKKYNKTRKH